MKASSSPWLKTVIITFFAGAGLLGLTDFFHTAAGVQRYLFSSDILMIGAFGWPWYIPVQMGIIALMVMTAWTLLFNHVLLSWSRIDAVNDVQPLGSLLPLVSVIMIAAGFVAGWAAIGYEHHLSLYLALYVASTVYFALFFSRCYLLAFLLVGIGGPLAEWLLLSPSVGYYEFVQKDLFGRVPGWQLFAYGWGGIFFHYVTAGIRLNRTA